MKTDRQVMEGIEDEKMNEYLQEEDLGKDKEGRSAVFCLLKVRVCNNEELPGTFEIPNRLVATCMCNLLRRIIGVVPSSGVRLKQQAAVVI